MCESVSPFGGLFGKLPAGEVWISSGPKTIDRGYTARHHSLGVHGPSYNLMSHTSLNACSPKVRG